jgi:hypothetical protein
MQLLIAHQILIGSAIALAVIFGLRSMVHYAHGGAAPDLVLTVVSVVLAGLLMMYFRKVRGRWLAAREQHEQRNVDRRG